MARSEPDLLAADLPTGSACRLADFQHVGAKKASDLWDRLIRDEWEIGKLLDGMNARRQADGSALLKAADLLEALASLAVKESAQAGKRGRRGWWSVLVVVLLVVVLLPVVWPLAQPRPATRCQYAVVSAIPPYHVIEPGDVRESEMPLDPRAAVGYEAVVGWYSSRALAKDDLVLTGDLKDARPFPGLKDRVILTVPVGHVDAALVAALPARVTLLAADTTGTSIPPLADVYLVAVTRPSAGGAAGAPPATEATVALPKAQLEAIRPFLRTWSMTVAWTPPR